VLSGWAVRGCDVFGEESQSDGGNRRGREAQSTRRGEVALYWYLWLCSIPYIGFAGVQTQRRRADGRCGVVACVERSRGATGATAEAERRRVHAEVKLRYIGICGFAAYLTSASLGCKRRGAERMGGAGLWCVWKGVAERRGQPQRQRGAEYTQR
jgi:hypothetical protein